MHQKLYGLIKIREFMYIEDEVGVMEEKRGKEAKTENKVDKPFFQINFF